MPACRAAVASPSDGRACGPLTRSLQTARRIQILADQARAEAKEKKIATRRGVPAPKVAVVRRPPLL